MKTNRIAAIAAVLSIAASSSLWAAPPGKHIIERVPHKHGSAEAKNVVVNHSVMKRIGPPGKGRVIYRSNGN